MLGSISQKYESGALGSAAISHDPADPGGKSYGIYQLASANGTLSDFLVYSGYSNSFNGADIGTPEFDSCWRALSSDPSFVLSQHDFIQHIHYEPARKFADTLGFANTPAINEALWSISVQHGQWKVILCRAHPHSNTETEKTQIEDLYTARREYVLNLSLAYTLKRALMIRYSNEERDVLRLVCDGSSQPVINATPDSEPTTSPISLFSLIVNSLVSIFKK